jgi:hypothetical protein
VVRAHRIDEVVDVVGLHVDMDEGDEHVALLGAARSAFRNRTVGEVSPRATTVPKSDSDIG